MNIWGSGKMSESEKIGEIVNKLEEIKQKLDELKEKIKKLRYEEDIENYLQRLRKLQEITE